MYIKKQGFTSHDVVASFIGIVGQKKLAIQAHWIRMRSVCCRCVWDVQQKLCDMLTDKDKVYEAVMLLGVGDRYPGYNRTDTKSSETDELTEEQVRAAVLDFVGDYNQVPPMYSALKINGKKLYGACQRRQRL